MAEWDIKRNTRLAIRGLRGGEVIVAMQSIDDGCGRLRLGQVVIGERMIEGRRKRKEDKRGVEGFYRRYATKGVYNQEISYKAAFDREICERGI